MFALLIFADSHVVMCAGVSQKFRSATRTSSRRLVVKFNFRRSLHQREDEISIGYFIFIVFFFTRLPVLDELIAVELDKMKPKRTHFSRG